MHLFEATHYNVDTRTPKGRDYYGLCPIGSELMRRVLVDVIMENRTEEAEQRERGGRR